MGRHHGILRSPAHRAGSGNERRVPGGPPDGRRRLMFATGTNLVTPLLKRNCVIPERAELYGPAATKEELDMRWQVRT